MAVNDDDKKYQDVIKTLKGLQQVKAPPGFEADLKRRISSEKFEPEKEKSFWHNILMPSRLVPSLGLMAATVIVFMVVTVNSEEMEDPFMIEPRLREDVIEVVDYDDFQEKKKEIETKKSLTKDETPIERSTNEVESMRLEEEDLAGRDETTEGEGITLEQPRTDDEGFFEMDASLPESTFAEVTGEVELTEPTTERATGLAISKEDLNFRQIQLTDEEQKVVDQLRMRVQSLEKEDAEKDIK